MHLYTILTFAPYESTSDILARKDNFALGEALKYSVFNHQMNNPYNLTRLFTVTLQNSRINRLQNTDKFIKVTCITLQSITLHLKQ